VEALGSWLSTEPGCLPYHSLPIPKPSVVQEARRLVAGHPYALGTW